MKTFVHGVCLVCGGVGTVWTGQKRIPCPAKNCRDGRIVAR